MRSSEINRNSQYGILMMPAAQHVTEYGIGDVIQFTGEVDRTLGKWLADGPADFHAETDNQRSARAILRERIEQVQTNLDRERAEVDRILREAIDLKEDH